MPTVEQAETKLKQYLPLHHFISISTPQLLLQLTLRCTPPQSRNNATEKQQNKPQPFDTQAHHGRRPWAPETPLPCQHSGEQPREQKAEDAAAVFSQCLQQHVFPQALESLRADEDNLRDLQTRIAQIKDEEMQTRQRLQKRLRRVSGILENARKILCGPLPGINVSENQNPQPPVQTNNNAHQSEGPTHPASAEPRPPSPGIDNQSHSAPHELALSGGHGEY